MNALRSTAILAMGLTLSACDGSWNGPVLLPSQGVYTASDYYGYAAPGAYAGGSIAPYPYQLPYGPPYGSNWNRREDWRSGGWRERRERAVQQDGHQRGSQPHQNLQVIPQITAQPRSFAPPAPPPPSAQPSARAASPSADQNRQLLDQLGFRPSR
jgi:hypothetical protein